MSKRIFYVVLLFLPIFSAAQKVVTGTVKDDKTKQPLQGASVLVKGGSTGTTTNASGEFSLSVPPQAKSITVSYVGYESKDIAIGNNTTGLEILLLATDQLTDIVVVGSRNLSRTRTETPVAVDIIPITQIVNQVGQVDLNQILTYVAPSFQSSRQTIADGTDHVDPAQLRGLGTDQILVLVNGKRRHQSALVNVNGTVNRGQVGTDLSAIPVTAIERVEVLRDGAAAQYGSDAIAGVINIVLKKNTGVLGGSVSYGQNVTAYPKDYALYKTTNRGDAPDFKVNDGGTLQAGLNYGFGFKNNGYINLSGEYNMRDFSNRTGTYTGQIYPSVGGQIKDDSIMAARGTNRNTFDMRIGNSKISGGSVMVNSQFPVGGGWNLNVFGGYNKKNGEAAGFYRYPNSIFANSGAGPTYRGEALELYPDGFLPLIQTNIQDYSISAAFEGKVGEWNASFSETFGVNTFGFTVDNSVNYTQFAIQTPTNAQTKFDAGELKFQQITSNIDFSRKFNVLYGMNLAFGSELRVD